MDVQYRVLFRDEGILYFPGLPHLADHIYSAGLSIAHGDQQMQMLHDPRVMATVVQVFTQLFQEVLNVVVIILDNADGRQMRAGEKFRSW